MQQIISFVSIIALIVSWFLWDQNKDLKEINEKQKAEIVSLTSQIEVAEEAREAYENIEADFNERIRKMEDRQNKFNLILARTPWAQRAEEDPEGLYNSMNAANKKWTEEYNVIGHE